PEHEEAGREERDAGILAVRARTRAARAAGDAEEREEARDDPGKRGAAGRIARRLGEQRIATAENVPFGGGLEVAVEQERGGAGEDRDREREANSGVPAGPVSEEQEETIGRGEEQPGEERVETLAER